MTRLRTFVLAALAALLLTAAPAGAVIGGQPDTAHPYVVALASSGTRLICSGSLLSAKVVVTAGHCVLDEEQGVLVASGAPIPQAWRNWAPIGTAHVHSGFCLRCVPGLPNFIAHDVAVVVLSQPITLPSDAPYPQLPRPGLADELGRSPLTVVGYGTPGFAAGGGQPWPVPLLDRRSANVELLPSQHAWRDEFLRISASHARICEGDSGGPNLVGNTIVAITSYSSRICGGNSYSYRLDTPETLAFIQGFLR